jgi:hypothetical protein
MSSYGYPAFTLASCMAREIAFFSSAALPAFIVTLNNGMRVSQRCKDGRAGHSSVAQRPIRHELNAIVAEGAEKGSKVIVYSIEALAISWAGGSPFHTTSK